MEPRYNILQLIICCLIALILGIGLMSFVVYWDQPKKSVETVQLNYLTMGDVWAMYLLEKGQFEIIEKKTELGKEK